MIENKDISEKVILVGVSTWDPEETAASLDELEELVHTAGAEVLDKVIQSREQVHPGTYLGRGKIEEVRMLVTALGATGVVCDDELSPAQMKNLEYMLDTKVMDRTLIILDIFAGRAITREGKIQVELAQLRYRAARLVGLRDSLSRLGGGIGTRGPGETKLETDRRVIHRRIGALKADLEEVRRHRETTRKSRERNRIPVAAIVGYTNAGKSTLLNRLTGAGILAEDKLFATLDPTTRNLVLPTGEEILLTDTVGFIRKLPHHLIEAFRSTLEEARYADVILHVVDASNPQMDAQMQCVYDTLKDLEITGKPVITVFNKIDRLQEPGDGSPEADPARRQVRLTDSRAEDCQPISARTGEGLDELQMLLANTLRDQKVYIERVYPYGEAGRVQQIRRYGQLLSEDYREDGIYVTGYMPAEWLGKI